MGVTKRDRIRNEYIRQTFSLISLETKFEEVNARQEKNRKASEKIHG